MVSGTVHYVTSHHQESAVIFGDNSPDNATTDNASIPS